MDCSSMLTAVHHNRSTSLECTSHPVLKRVEEEIIKMKSLIPYPDVDVTCTCLGVLEDLYCCFDDLARLPLVRQSLFRNGRDKVEEELDMSIKLLDLWDNVRDFLSVMKAQVLDLQVSIRRRGELSDISKHVEGYVRQRKKAQKDINKCLAVLKQVEGSCEASSCNDEKSEVSVIVRLLPEVRALAVAQLRAILCFMALPKSSSMPGKWSSVSKVMRKGKRSCEESPESKCVAESAVVSLLGLCGCGKDVDADKDKVVKVHKELKRLETAIEGLEEGLGRVYKKLIQNRVSLLNIFSP